MPVGQSTHREVVAVIQSRSRVQLKVRSGGLIPVRNRRSEPLSWRVVTPSERGNSGLTELVRREVEVNSNKPKVRSVEEADQCTEQRLQINLHGQQGLGCSICKVSFIIEQLAPLPVDTVPCGTHKQWAGAACSFLRTTAISHAQCKEQNVTQPCCQVVLDLSRPPLPTHQCHVSPA